MVNLKSILKPQFIQTWIADWKEHGFKQFVKQRGLKVVIVIFIFYLIRDSLLYLLLPYLAARGLLGC